MYKHSSWTAADGQFVHSIIVEMLLDQSDLSDIARDAEERFGNWTFDNNFSRVTLDELISFLREWADDNEKGWGGVKDFLGTVEEFMAMPCDSLQRRMAQASRRAFR